MERSLDTTINEKVSVNGIDSVRATLGNYIDEIITDINSIDMIIYNLDDYFKGNIADELRSKFETYRNKYEILKMSLNTFVSDLAKVKDGIDVVTAMEARRLEDKARESELQAKRTKVEL